MKNAATSLIDFLAFQPVRSPRTILYWLQLVSSEEIIRALQKGSCYFYQKFKRDGLCNVCIKVHSYSLQSVYVNLTKVMISLLSCDYLYKARVSCVCALLAFANISQQSDLLEWVFQAKNMCLLSVASKLYISANPGNTSNCPRWCLENLQFLNFSYTSLGKYAVRKAT